MKGILLSFVGLVSVVLVFSCEKEPLSSYRLFLIQGDRKCSLF